MLASYSYPCKSHVVNIAKFLIIKFLWLGTYTVQLIDNYNFIFPCMATRVILHVKCPSFLWK